MNLNDLIDNLKEILIGFFPDISLLQVGSSTTKKVYNDIDFLIISDDKEEIIDGLFKIFKNFKVEKIDDAVKIINYFNKEISFAIYETDYFSSLINKYLIGSHVICEHKTWSIGYWLIEGFIYDIKNSKIINDSHNIKDLKKILKKDHIYAKRQILKECLEEIKIKSNYLDKSIIQDNILKQDILIATLRSFSILSKIPLRGFKNIESVIDKLPQQYKMYLYQLLNNDYSCINNIIDIISNYIIDNNNCLYMGTWQFNGNFKSFKEGEILKLLEYAKQLGIKRFDTALVYGNAEKVLGQFLGENDIVLTKIPAKIKPNIDDDRDINTFYDYEYIKTCISKSSADLKRNVIDIVLLHNWNSNWDSDKQMISLIKKIKEDGVAKRVGISLPNNYNNTLNKNILELIDVIEAPYNEENMWIENDINLYKSYNIEIILRSLFLQGSIIKKNKNKYYEILDKVLNLNTSMVIGMTTEEQVKENFVFIRRKKNERL